jgi:hypothetical protein
MSKERVIDIVKKMKPGDLQSLTDLELTVFSGIVNVQITESSTPSNDRLLSAIGNGYRKKLNNQELT